MTAPGINPYIQGIGTFFQGSLPIFRQRDAFQQRFFVVLEPPLRPVFFNFVAQRLNHVRIQQRLIVFVEKRRQRNAPGTLAADTPVGTRRNGTRNALFSPIGQPLNFLDRCLCPLLQRIQADKPLRQRARNYGRFRTPTMRVRMRIRRLMQKSVFFFQQRNHRLIRRRIALRRPNGFPDQFRRHTAFRHQTTVVIHGAGDFQVVLQTRQIIIHSVPRSRMHTARAGIQRYVIGTNNGTFEI